MVLAERLQHLFGTVDEIEDVGRILARIRAIEAGKGLHCLNAGKAAINVHPAQQGLVKPGLELVGDEQDLEVVLGKGVANIAALQSGVEPRAGLCKRLAFGFGIVDLTGKRHQRTHAVSLRANIGVNRQLPSHRLQPAAQHDHRFGLPFE